MLEGEKLGKQERKSRKRKGKIATERNLRNKWKRKWEKKCTKGKKKEAERERKLGKKRK